MKFYLRQLIDFLIEPGKNQFVFISADRCPIIKSGGKQPRSQQEQSGDAELEQRGVDTEFSAGSPGAAEKQIDGQSQQQNARKQIDVDQLDEVGNMLDVGVEFFAVGGEVKAQAVQLPAIVGDDGKFVGGKEISSFKAFFVPDFGELSLGLVYFSKISLSLSLNCSWLSRRIFQYRQKAGRQKFCRASPSDFRCRKGFQAH